MILPRESNLPPSFSLDEQSRSLKWSLKTTKLRTENKVRQGEVRGGPPTFADSLPGGKMLSLF